MFTGIVETVGVVQSIQGHNPLRITIGSDIPTAEVRLGDSVAIDGCCLTVVEKQMRSLSFEAAQQTLKLTTLGTLHTSDQVNLERAVSVQSRLDGHLVLGHVDTVGTIETIYDDQNTIYMRIATPETFLKFIAPQGSITVSGVSLTVTDVQANLVSICLIPHTLHSTNFHRFSTGSRVNLEVDVIARYVDRLLNCDKKTAFLTEEYLKDKGF